MKLTIDKEHKNIITLADIEAVNKMKECFKEQQNLDWEIERALILASDGCSLVKAMKPEITVAKNCRVWDYYGKDTGTLDVWVVAYGFSSYKGFYEVGFYVSDIWQLGSENEEETKQRLYIRHFQEVK